MANTETMESNTMATTEKDDNLHLLFQYQISGFLNCLLEYDKTYSNELTIVRRFLHILNVFLQNYHTNETNYYILRSIISSLIFAPPFDNELRTAELLNEFSKFLLIYYPNQNRIQAAITEHIEYSITKECIELLQFLHLQGIIIEAPKSSIENDM
jgi:hypothetical protein